MTQPIYECTVKNLFNLTFNKVFFFALILVITINVIGVISSDALLKQTISPLFIPVFLIFFFVKHKLLGIAFVSFLMFSFLGDISPMFFSGEYLIQSSSILHFTSYLFLLIIVVPKFKLLEMSKLIGIYLLVVFLICLYFLYIVYGVLETIMPNSTEVLLFGIKSLTLIVLAFVSFGVYLNTQTKESTLFLTAVVFLGLSTILYYINLYYLYDWSFELLQRILYAIGLYVMFKYVISLNITIKHKPILINESYSTDNILA